MIAFIGVGKISLEHLKVLDKLNIKVNFAYSKSIKSKSWKIFKEKSSSTIFQENIIKILNNKKIKFIFFFLPWNINNTYLNINHNHNKIYFYEKPLALDLKQLDKLKNYKKNNILVGYNRRFYNTVNKLKNRILKGGLISVDVNISEDLNNLISRHGKSVLKYSLEYSSCHILDLVFYLFGNLKLIKVYKIKTQYSNVGFFNFKITAENVKKVPINISIFCNDSVNIGIFTKFNDHTNWELSPIEKLKVFKGYKKNEPTKKRNIRIYTRKLISEIEEKSVIKPGFENQMKNLLKGNFLYFSKPQDNYKLIKFINDIKKK